MTVREDAIRRADGTQGIYGVVDKPDFALVIPLDGERVRLVEQYRYPIGLRRWEFPQGTAPDRADTDPLALAARELREETGLRAGKLVALGLLDVAPGMSSQRGRVFLATDLVEGFHEREPEEQDMRSAWFARADFEKMITRGEITDAQSIAAYTLLLLHEHAQP
ncbi:NUDIX hydrolase [Lentzea sp. NPDC042327]|uniref:NUDIX hydrolase n=1 Tax=Lentzea sp. NPDC042327 TaxID=3154801 RepID=UPI0033DF7EBC